eukprot:g31224.t1
MANPPTLHIFRLWRKLEHPEEAHAGTGRMCKLHTDSNLRVELNLGPWRCETAVLTAELLCFPNIQNIIAPFKSASAGGNFLFLLEVEAMINVHMIKVVKHLEVAIEGAWMDFYSATCQWYTLCYYASANVKGMNVSDYGTNQVGCFILY